MNWYKQAVLDNLSYVIYALLQRAKTDDMYQEDITNRFGGEDPYKLKQALEDAQGMMGFGRGVAPNQAQIELIKQIDMIASGTDPNSQMKNKNKNQPDQINEDYLGLSNAPETGQPDTGNSTNMQSNLSI